MSRQARYVALGLLVMLVTGLIISNARSLYEGLFYYVRGALLPEEIQPVPRDGRYASLYELVRLRNAERLDYILRRLDLPGLSAERIPIPNSLQQDVFVRLGSSGPLTIFCAHYDKAHDDPAFQGASDNTAAVSVLLASIEELTRRGTGGNRAFLFTGEEETGLGGATAFVNYARAHQLAIREIVDLDSLGRGRLTIRPSADLPGYVFTLPIYGDVVYDGTRFRANRPFPPANLRLTNDLVRVHPDMLVLERFTALSDSNVFQANGIDTVAISADDMYYLELAWDTYADRVELLDVRSLDRAFDLILRYPP